jgi:hypothetical protein
MKMLKREFFLFVAVTAFVAFCGLAWGGPFMANQADPATVYAAGAPASMTGSVLRSGDQLIFRTGAGLTYRIDQMQQAQPFAGQAVTITGSVDAGTVHVVAIHPAA